LLDQPHAAKNLTNDSDHNLDPTVAGLNGVASNLGDEEVANSWTLKRLHTIRLPETISHEWAR
jgi:hypothetical protein